MLLGHLRKLDTNITFRLPAKIEAQDVSEEEEVPGEELRGVQLVHTGFKVFSIHQHGCVMLLALKQHYTAIGGHAGIENNIPSYPPREELCLS